jgi:outer membrane protein OmpA-like peptidoglycan-associated protein
MLNALSERDAERARMVLNSVAAVFGPLDILGAESGKPAPSGELVAREADRIGDALANLLPDMRLAPTRPGDLARFAVPASSLFVAESESPRPGATAVIGALADALLHPPAGLALSIEVVAAEADASAGGDSLGGRRAARLARELAGAGVDPSRIAVGLARMNGELLTIGITWTDDGTSGVAIP